MLNRIMALALLGGVSIAAQPAFAAPAYTLAASIPLGAPDRWDYAVADPSGGRVYVAHGDRVAVVDAHKLTLVGEVQGIPGGTHGTAISTPTGQGFTDDGRNGQAIAFDLKSLAVTRRIPAAEDADSMTIDPVSGHVFVIEGDPGTITVVDPRSDTAVATIAVGEKMEYAATDGRGSLYVAGVAKRDLLRIDGRSNTVTARWPTPDCAAPHGLAIDAARRRVFVGCENQKLMVVDADSGRVVAELPIGRGNDAVAYDPVRRRVFASNGRDGTVSVFQQASADTYAPLDPILTQVSGRTMTVDPKTGDVFVPAAQLDPNSPPGGFPHAEPGTLKLLVFKPAG